MFDKLEALLIRFEELLTEISSPGVADDPNRFRALMKEQSDLAPIVEAYQEYKKAKQTVEESLVIQNPSPESICLWNFSAASRMKTCAPC